MSVARWQRAPGAVRRRACAGGRSNGSPAAGAEAGRRSRSWRCCSSAWRSSRLFLAGARQVAVPALQPDVDAAASARWFSLQNSLQRAAPLLLTALCVALPARLGLVVIGGEGAVVLGGCRRRRRRPCALRRCRHRWSSCSPWAIAGMAAGGIWIGLVGALAPLSRRQRDHLQPAARLYRHRADEPAGRRAAARSRPASTSPRPSRIGDAYMLGNIPGMDVHWGLAVGVVACIASWVLIEPHHASALPPASPAAMSARGPDAGPAGRRADRRLRRAGRRLRRARRHDRGRGRPGQRQRLARRRLRLYRHPRRLPRPPQPAGDHPGRLPARRHRRLAAG